MHIPFASYHKQLAQALEECVTTDKQGCRFSIEHAVDQVLHLMTRLQASERKALLVGNGGSAAIVSHLQNDLCKACNLRAMTLTETPLLTAYTNDDGYDCAFAKQIQLWGEMGDTLIAVSSSGQSENILHAVHTARAREMTVITFSGFTDSNALRQMGDLNFYIPSMEYGIVELAHSILVHYLSDQLHARVGKQQSHLVEQYT